MRSADEGRTPARANSVVLAVALVFGFVLLASVLAVGGNSRPGDDRQTTDDSEPLNGTATERAVAEAVNHERTARSFDSVDYDAGLAAVARNHSADMIARGYYAHEPPDGDVTFDRVEASPVSCSSGGENIAATWWQQPFETVDGDRNSHTTVEQWLYSPEHRRSMLIVFVVVMFSTVSD